MGKSSITGGIGNHGIYIYIYGYITNSVKLIGGFSQELKNIGQLGSSLSFIPKRVETTMYNKGIHQLWGPVIVAFPTSWMARVGYEQRIDIESMVIVWYPISEMQSISNLNVNLV